MRWGAIALMIAVGCAPAHATEAVNYTYDALGRLVTVANTGDMNNGQSTTTTFDAAGNRTNYNVSVVTTISIGNVSVQEGGALVFTVTRLGYTANAVSAQWATSGGTATSGVDFTAGSGTVSFAAGETSKTISVATIDDSTNEPSETMSVTLSTPAGGAVLGNAVGTGTILDNDGTAQLSVAGATANEGSPLSFTATRSGNTASAVSASWATSNGTAIAGTNYTASSGTVSFSAGATSTTVSVPTIDDHVVTGNLGMTVTLSAPSAGATLGTSSATGTINNIDTAWTSVLTAGTTITFNLTQVGYMAVPVTGSMTVTTYNTYTVAGVFSVNGSTTYLQLTGAAAPPNSGWTSITIPGVGTKTRATATYAVSGTKATWSWTAAATVASGTVSIQ